MYMFKTGISILTFLILTCKLFSQEVLPLSSTQDLESLKESKKGKVVLVNFWATWCKPCVSEFPDLVKLYNNYKDKNFSMVFISVDVPEDVQTKVIPFLKEKGVDFTTYYNNFDKIDDLINYFDTSWQGGVPSTYIYDRNWKQTFGFLGEKSYNYFENEIRKDLD